MKKLVIIGGGFAGAKIAKALESEFNVTLIDSKDYFEFTPSILRAIIKTKYLKKIQILHKYYLKKSKIIKGRVEEINKDKVILKNNSPLKFDYLVICSGSSYNAPFKEQDIVIATRGNHIMNCHSKLKKAKNITIIGGGLVGIELAGEILWKFPFKKVTIIQSKGKILSRNHQKSINYSKKYLENRGVKIIYGERAITKNKDTILTNKGTKIKSDLVFICTGILPNSKFMIPKFNKGLINYVPKEKPMVISLGRYNGIFEYKGIVLFGIIPAFLKWFIEKKTMIKYKN